MAGISYSKDGLNKLTYEESLCNLTCLQVEDCLH